MGITSIKLRNISLVALIFTLFTFASVYPVAAQQGVPIDRDSGVDIVAGPHNVTVVVVNQNLAAGFIQMALLITVADTGAIVPDARVIIMADNEGQDYEGWATALNSPADLERYDVRMNLGSTGKWKINVDVSSSLGQGGAEALTLEVPALNRYTSGSMVFFGIFAAMMLGVAYLFWSVKRNNRRKREVAQGESQG